MNFIQEHPEVVVLIAIVVFAWAVYQVWTDKEDEE